MTCEIILSCGHKSEHNHGHGFYVTVKDTGCDAIDGFYNTASYMCVCEKCKKWYKKHGQILKTEGDVDRWLNKNPVSQNKE